MHFDGVVYKEVELPPSVRVELDLGWRTDADNPVLLRLLELLGAPAPTDQIGSAAIY